MGDFEFLRTQNLNSGKYDLQRKCFFLNLTEGVLVMGFEG